jgi:hypothetical protein
MPKSKFKKEKIVIGIGVFIALVSLGVFSPTASKSTSVATLPVVKAEEVAVVPNETVITVLEINGVKYESTVESQESVYDFMAQLQNEGKINFKSKTYTGMGKFIDELNGIRGNGDKYWIYYVNNKKARIGVSNYKINPGDVVSWRYEKDIN